MSSAKLIHVYGLLSKLETTYNDGSTTLAAASDGALLAERVVARPQYVHSGERGRAPGTGGLLKRSAPSGKWVEFAPRFEGRGAGSAYSASNLPPDVNTFMRISGHAATVVTTSSTESVTYAPVSSSFASAAMELYERGEKHPVTGAYASLRATCDAAGFLMFEFPTQGLLGTAADASVPSITYNSTNPPKAVGAGLSIGSWDPVWRSVTFEQNRQIAARADGNSTGHKGFSMGGYAPTFSVTVESAALATFDPYAALHAATSHAIDFTVGSTQYNRIAFAAGYAQLTDVEPGDDDPSATWTLTFSLSGSTPAANDAYSWAWT